MATIGTFTAADNGYGGSVKTLTLNFRAKFIPTEKDNDRAPDYRIIAGAIERAPPGRRPHGTAIANISRSSSTIRVFRRRSMPRW